MPTASPAVVLLGDVNVDLHLDIDTYPVPGGDAIATGQRLGLGGSATNTAVVVARLGGPTRLVGRVGRDLLGRFALEALAAEGVDIAQLAVDDGEPTATNVVAVTPDGERTMFAYRGANARLEPEQLQRRLFDGVRVVHLSGYSLLAAPQRLAALRAAEWAGAVGADIVLDVPVAGADQAAAEILALTPQLTVIAVGEREVCRLTGVADPDGACAALLDRGCRAVALKRGAGGSSMYRKSGRVDVAAMPVQVVDTTGAGDAFVGALIHGMATGLDDRAALLLANAAGALATTRRGAGRALPDRAELLAALTASEPVDAQTDAAVARAIAALASTD